MTELYCTKRFLLMTLDPVHIGTGGMRLGRVDNSIVREPGTRLPKIPGTSLSGAIRQYAAMRYESRRCAGAGQGDEKKGKEGHCASSECPICYTFGHIKGGAGGNEGQSGTVNIGDARLFLFPVYSLAGPVWVTCPTVLAEWGIAVTVADDKVKGKLGKNHLNLGWLMLEKESGDIPSLPEQVPALIKDRVMLVSDKLFSQIVNSNLEVRTSVSIDPETGAAKDGALFTYEAIPRAAILWLDVVEDDFKRSFRETTRKCKVTESTEQDGKKTKVYEHNKGDALKPTWKKPLDVVEAGLRLAEHLGIGGMGTRGFGRIRLLEEA